MKKEKEYKVVVVSETEEKYFDILVIAKSQAIAAKKAAKQYGLGWQARCDDGRGHVYDSTGKRMNVHWSWSSTEAAKNIKRYYGLKVRDRSN